MFLSSRCSSPAPSQAAREASRLPHGRQGGPRRPSAAITLTLRRISKKVNLWKIARVPCCGEGARHRKVIREGTLREIGRDARVIHARQIGVQRRRSATTYGKRQHPKNCRAEPQPALSPTARVSRQPEAVSRIPNWSLAEG